MNISKIVLATLAFSAVNAKADIIKCVFTEPFYTTSYSMAQQSLTIVNDGENTKKVIKNVSFQIKPAINGITQFEIVGKDKVVIQTLALDNQGSDGMSDQIFPYSVKWPALSTNANSGIGGCTSNYLKATGE